MQYVQDDVCQDNNDNKNQNKDNPELQDSRLLDGHAEERGCLFAGSISVDSLDNQAVLPELKSLVVLGYQRIVAVDLAGRSDKMLCLHMCLKKERFH